MRWKIPGIMLAVGVLFLAACGKQAGEAFQPVSSGLKLQMNSTAFPEGGQIPIKYTCDGKDISPPLSWTGVPEEAQSLVLIADDPDAPAGVWVHWVIYDMPPMLDNLPEGVPTEANLAGTGVQGQNDFQNTGYGGPCPPGSKPHRYHFKLFALDQMLNLSPEATKAQVEDAMKDHILAEGRLIGEYGR